MITSLMLSVAVGSISLVQNSSKLCGSALEVDVVGLTSIESPLKNETIIKVPPVGTVDLGKPEAGYFTFVGADGKGHFEALSVLLLPAGTGCFTVQTNTANVVNAAGGEALLQKFWNGFGKLDSATLQSKWVAKLGDVALGATPAVLYCTLTSTGFGAMFAVSCLASVGGLVVDTGFAFLQAARELMELNGVLTAEESSTLNKVMSATSLAAGVGVSIVAGKTPAELLKDWKMAVSVVGAVVKSSNTDGKTKSIASVGLAASKKYITVVEILAKTTK